MTDPIRPATPDDIPAIRAILAQHGNDSPEPTVDIVGPYVRHLVATARALVTVEEGEVVAFGATVATGRGRHLADLFVGADRLGRGIGRPLLDELFAGEWPRTTFASDDPRALPLYIRAGMSPRGVCLYLEGPAAGIPDARRDLSVEPVDGGRIADLERAWTGIDRSVDHGHWSTQPEADSFIVFEDGEAIAAGHARARQVGTARALNRLVIRPGAEPIAPICAALRRAARGGSVVVAILGTNPAVRPLLEGGFRIADRDTFMASAPDLVDPDRLLPNSGML